MKYKFNELFKGKLPVPLKWYDQLEDLEKQIIEGVQPRLLEVKNVKLTKKELKKAFGKPKDFNTFAIIHNDEGSYLVIADDDKYKFIALQDI